MHARLHASLFDAVLFDRDGTLIVDVPYNGDPAAVRPVPGARAALAELRRAGLRIGVVTNQSGVGSGRISGRDVDRVHRRLVELLGPVDTIQVCPHAPDAGCDCRKPAPGLIQRAARALGTDPSRCVVVGDIGSDMAAAGAAGASGILVPTDATRPEEIAAAPAVAGDLAGAVGLILRRERLVRVRPVERGRPAERSGTGDLPRPGTLLTLAGRRAERARPVERGRPADRSAGRPGGRVLVVRGDSAGDVLLTGPAIRAVAAGADEVVLLCGPRGRAAARLLPGVDRLLEWSQPWLEPAPDPVDPVDQRRFVERIADLAPDQAIIFTSYHQSPLPLALLLRLAGVPRISAISDDYPGSLLDLRHRVPMGVPEPERALSLAAAAGFRLLAGDPGGLAVRPDRLAPPPVQPAGHYVVVHPGSSVPARACPPERCREIVAALVAAGHRVLVTGGPDERELTGYVAGGAAADLNRSTGAAADLNRSTGAAADLNRGTGAAEDLGGRTDLAQLGALLADADCVVVGNTGPAHLAAAVGTPVVSLFAPTVPFGQWGPYRVPTVRLGEAAADCRHSRATRCPVPGHPCLSGVEPGQVVAAVATLTRERNRQRGDPPMVGATMEAVSG